MIIDEEIYLAHYGILRKSGRYPWGSGETPYERSTDFFGHVSNLRRQGLSDLEIARGMALYTESGKPWTSTEFRQASSIAKNAKRAGDAATANRLRDKGMSNVKVGEAMGINESQVRALLAPGVQDKLAVLHNTADMLKAEVDENPFLDVSSGVEYGLNISRDKLDTAIAILKDQGYKIQYYKIPQLGTGNETSVKVLVPEGTPYSFRNLSKIHQVQHFSQDGGHSYVGIKPPISIDSSRVDVRYGPDGGSKSDGVIYVRPGVKDISIGSNSYAQVRVAVDDSHYLKGMAIYKDDLPKGTDLVFNTNKSDSGNKLDAFKKMETDKDGNIDRDNPFGSSLKRQITERDQHGNEKVSSAMNIVNEEGDWDEWSKNLSSQFLSKQSISLAKGQLDVNLENKKTELDDILQLTNPTVRKTLLNKFAEDADSSAVHLKAAALPRQETKAILPIESMKENEIYAPTFHNGERVVLVRHPHGGTFEIPELTVNNRQAEAKKVLGPDAKDAVGISHKTAERLSGADFDGDSVLVIPNDKGSVKTAPALEGLKAFEPKALYPKYDGMKVMTSRQTQQEMGSISNLITDMTIKKAPNGEVARAVRHSMVVIDAEKHELNYKQSALDNNIKQLKEKYQKDPSTGKGGAATLVSRAGSQVHVVTRKPRPAAEGGAIDRLTGELKFVPKNETITTKDGTEKIKTFKSKKLAETSDAFTLSSGTPIEKVYADYSNKMKDLANQARLRSIHTQNIPYNPSARIHYKDEVASLNASLRIALRNAPLERQAQIVANTLVEIKRQANPNMDSDDLKKVKGQSLTEARIRTGAGKQRISISEEEWNAIQAGAISPNLLTKILNNSDLDTVKKLATPKKRQLLMTPTKQARANTMLASGYTQAEVAQQLGVSLTTLKTSLKK